MDFFNSAIEVLQTLVVALGQVLESGERLTCWKVTVMTIRGPMLMCHKVTHKKDRQQPYSVYNMFSKRY